LKLQISLLFALLFSGVYNYILGQKPEFFREEISFGIDSVFFSVNGDYYFRNTSDQTRNYVIAYPVRSNNTPKPIDTIMVFDQDYPAQLLQVEIRDTLATFAITLSPHSVKSIKVFYRQRHNQREARYILLTTNFWEKPFEKADYSLAVRKNIRIDDFSIKPDSRVDFGETEIFYWNRENFMPETDFEVKFTLLNF
jgi:hypothetical protein